MHHSRRTCLACSRPPVYPPSDFPEKGVGAILAEIEEILEDNRDDRYGQFDYLDEDCDCPECVAARPPEPATPPDEFKAAWAESKRIKQALDKLRSGVIVRK